MDMILYQFVGSVGHVHTIPVKILRRNILVQSKTISTTIAKNLLLGYKCFDCVYWAMDGMMGFCELDPRSSLPQMCHIFKHRNPNGREVV
jgi:hypothetical protein